MTAMLERASTRRQVLGGLVVRREAWTLSRRGWLFLGIVVLVTLLGFVPGAYPFLAVNNGGAGEVMVVAGWIGGRQIDAAAAAFRRGGYRDVVVRDLHEGGNKWPSGHYTADYVAGDLVQQGVPKEVVHILFCPVVRKDRTYHCGLAVREWLQQQRTTPTSLDVVTLATHAR